MQAAELFREGKLAAAVEACQQRLRSEPQDLTHRTLLFELLSFQGQWERAGRQLEFLGKQQADSEWAAQVYSNLLAAEQLRQSWASQAGQSPGFLLDPPAYVLTQVEACRAYAQQNFPEAQQLLANAIDASPTLTGQFQGEPFSGLRDCDDLLAPVLEIYILRDYIWVPWEQIRELEVAPPERPRDLIWAPVRLELVDGVQRRGYVPTRYPLSHHCGTEDLQLGRLTEWEEDSPGIVTGRGLKCFLLGERDPSILELNELQIAPSVQD